MAMGELSKIIKVIDWKGNLMRSVGYGVLWFVLAMIANSATDIGVDRMMNSKGITKDGFVQEVMES